MHVGQNRPRGRLLLLVHEHGAEVARRTAANMVLRGGATLIAGLFSGAAGMGAIDGVGVGFATEPATAELTALTPPKDATIPATSLRAPLAAHSFTLVTDQADAVQVKIAAVFKPTQDLQNVTEAGLLAGSTLYNQVIFEPVALNAGQDVTFFWQVDFPFGH